MGKYIFYLIVAFVIAFAADFFGFVDIPFPWEQADEIQVNEGRQRTSQAIDEMFKDQQ